jgi:hypothetical protein
MKTFLEATCETSEEAALAAEAREGDVVISAAVHGLYPEADLEDEKWWW